MAPSLVLNSRPAYLNRPGRRTFSRSLLLVEILVLHVQTAAVAL